MLNLTEKVACGCVGVWLRDFLAFLLNVLKELLVDLHKNHVIVTSAVLRLSR